MKNWLTSLILVLTLASGVLAGTPVFSGNAENGMSAMECCKKKMKDCNGANSVSAAMACCSLNCNNPIPNSPSPTFNFSPSAIIISDSILKQIASLLKKERVIQTVSFPFEREIFSQKHQPKYIQHHSFLI